MKQEAALRYSAVRRVLVEVRHHPLSPYGAGGLVVLLFLLITSVLYTVLVLTIVGITWIGIRRVSAVRSRRIIAITCGTTAILICGAILNLAQQQAPIAPTTQVSITTSGAGSQTVAAAIALDPADSIAWEWAGTVDPTSTATSLGTVEIERALMLSPDSRRPALMLATLYLGYGSPLVNTEIASYYTAMAGYVAPPGPPN